jgi:hypothetical protein
MKAWVCGALILAAASTAAFAQSKQASYSCVAEAAGGVAYNPVTKKWEGTAFDVAADSSRFVLRLAPNKLTITPSGSSSVNECVESSGRKYEWSIRCTAALTDFVFDLGSNRYLAAYLVGYVGGDNNGTPSVTAGTCKKIN